MRTVAAIAACLAVTTMYAQNTSGASSIRYDGIYYQASSYSTNYLRFYEDGTVISMSSLRPISQIKEEYFDKDNGEIQMYLGKGKYTLKGGQISFRETTETGSTAGNYIDYDGQIYENKLILNSHAKNGYESSNREFLFTAWSDISNEKASSSAKVDYPYTLEPGVKFRVNRSAYKMFYGLLPGNERYGTFDTYEHWGFTGSNSQSNSYIGLPNNSDKKYLELTVWFINNGDKGAKIYFHSNDNTLLDCSLLYGDNQSVPVSAFVIPGASGVGNGKSLMITEWKGDLFFTLKPKEETWITILFLIPENVSEAKFQLKNHALIPVSIPEIKQ